LSLQGHDLVDEVVVVPRLAKGVVEGDDVCGGLLDEACPLISSRRRTAVFPAPGVPVRMYPGMMTPFVRMVCVDGMAGRVGNSTGTVSTSTSSGSCVDERVT